MSEEYAYVNALGMPATKVQELLARVDLLSETVILTQYREGVPVSSYEIAPDSLAAAFSGIPITTGLLPRETLCYRRSDLREQICVFLPAGKRTMTVQGIDQGTATLRVPLPPLVFAGCGLQYAVFAVKRRPEPGDRLYCAPLPNVYSNGAVCRGNAEFPICTTRTIYQAIDVFFESTFNFHLVNRKSHSDPDDVIALWRKLVERRARKWPVKDLVISQYTMTDLVEGEWSWNSR